MKNTAAEPKAKTEVVKDLTGLIKWWDEEAKSLELDKDQTKNIQHFVVMEMRSYQDHIGKDLWTTAQGRNIREDIIHSALSKLSGK